jgi:hypothetical protein
MFLCGYTVVFCLASFRFVSAQNDTGVSIFDRTWQHHKTSFLNLDTAEICLDYTEDAHIIVVNHIKHERKDYKGKAGCESMFNNLFPKLTGPGIL